MEIRLDSKEGTCIGTVKIDHTKGELREFETKLKSVQGVHDLYFVFKGSPMQKGNLFMLDWWEIK